MKKYFLIAIIFVVAFTTFFLQSCRKDKDFDSYKYGLKEGHNQAVSIPLAVAGFTSYAFNFVDTQQTVQTFAIQLESDVAASTDLHANLVLNPDLVTAYNDSNGTNLIELPTDLYSIPSLKVTIPKGSKTAYLNIVVPNAQLLSPLETYGVGFTLTSVDEAGYPIPDNFKNLVVEFLAKNKYDGHYRVNGSFLDVPNPAFKSLLPNEVDLITVGPNEVTVNRLVNGATIPAYLFLNATGGRTYYGNFGALFSFDPATDKLDSVTNAYGQGVTPQLRWAFLDNTGLNYFDPAARTIYAKYTMNQPNPTTVRAKFDEVYTYLGPR